MSLILPRDPGGPPFANDGPGKVGLSGTFLHIRRGGGGVGSWQHQMTGDKDDDSFLAHAQHFRSLFPLQVEGDESDEGGDEAECEADAQENSPARGGRGGGGEAGVAATLAPTATRGQGGRGRVGWQSCKQEYG